ncbi:glycine betaine ABC transporter substrate-binding protein OsmF [Amphibiibacter pelophylacis]|uniref:ABC transporter substrate-binding protein n=1 Tax=Amphibiibacter pelophylacis TaxID=1799477 RepID=A0ACC6P5B6_9BURK
MTCPINTQRRTLLALLGSSALLAACGKSGGDAAAPAASSDSAAPSATPAASAAPAASGSPVRVASKIDGEGALLGHMLVMLLEHHGIPVTARIQMGATKVVREALLAGEIDLYPEYTGNGAFMVGDEKNPAWRNLEQGYELVRRLDAANGLVWLKPAPANNTWAIALRRDLADREKVHSLADLKAALDKGMPFKIAAGAEFVERSDALPAFEATYGFKLKQDNILAFPGNDTAVFIKAAAEQTSGVNAATVYATDGAVSAVGLEVLADPQGAQPVYAPAPVIRKAVLDAYPKIPGILEPVFATLDTQTLQKLNGAVGVEGREASAVVSEYLKSKGFL